MVLRCNRQEVSIRFLETGGVLLPEQVMQEHPHRIHAEPLRPAQFLIDLLRIKAAGLPHPSSLIALDGIKLLPTNQGWV